MNESAYLFDISRATSASDLHALGADIKEDDTLDTVEKEDLMGAVRDRFCKLNAEAVGPVKPRW